MLLMAAVLHPHVVAAILATAVQAAAIHVVTAVVLLVAAVLSTTVLLQRHVFGFQTSFRNRFLTQPTRCSRSRFLTPTT